MLFSVAMPVKYIGGNPELVSIVMQSTADCLYCCWSALFGVGKH